jgi:lipoprotein-anchoring transpeptidase ErfK/SrfK
MTRSSPFEIRRALVMTLVIAVAMTIPSSAAPAGRSTRVPAPATSAPRASRGAPARALDPAVINVSHASATVRAGAPRALTLRAQVLLDRAHFRVGEIDGGWGMTMQRTVEAFQRARGLPPSGVVDAATWAALETDTDPIVTAYTITPEDVAGPFVPIPEDMAAKATLPYLGYTSALEALAERFHASPRALRDLNPDKTIATAGEEIQVPNLPVRPAPAADSVLVDAAARAVEVLDVAGTTVAHFPATTGSTHDPLPAGRWRIEGRAWNPPFHYNPRLFWDADPSDAEAMLPPGPNNPVGLVWIELSKPHYGIHGTPEPAHIGRTQSHGCIRLTNWDALELADLVKPGTIAVLRQ